MRGRGRGSGSSRGHRAAETGPYAPKWNFPKERDG